MEWNTLLKGDLFIVTWLPEIACKHCNSNVNSPLNIVQNYAVATYVLQLLLN